ncbi:LEAF RUST 10 DISEASE-RESISTANCE LOCUS RECEPTOR-LIKE PROTEIN KINASE-like 1.2 [Populus trichocarpa]|uniref:Wall-associated receptor kinase galacturonan-binding domain-containing protein n=1 Tax=Populus trichocarpa TaxID=3694 RepID=A0A2K1ZU78_POPTR|nr:LEAF RUST 10 DISEASE-RESISTANCE LOCUS RECEPTOR-LIKE PROTEIN KINASE-like 1.2 [Populus trichocarpa]
MFSGTLRHLFGAYAALLFLQIIAIHHSCSARKNSNYCSPSSCGNIHNISYPFRLNTDPKSCGHQSYELVCENNRPTLYLKTVKYYVQAIEYSNFTVRLVEAAVQKDDCFSIPHRSLIAYDNYISYRNYLPYNFGFDNLRTDFMTFRLTFITCENPVLSPPDYIVDASSCKNENSTAYNSTFSSRNAEGYSYVLVAADLLKVPDLCRINLIYSAPGSVMPENMTNISYRDVHDILLYGFELSWYSACCDSVNEIQ